VQTTQNNNYYTTSLHSPGSALIGNGATNYRQNDNNMFRGSDGGLNGNNSQTFNMGLGNNDNENNSGGLMFNGSNALELMNSSNRGAG
jgi:hypothetical protein